ncbi:MAG: winged helix-turn-helix domain-containing protein, partial [Myxococcaceae bacterium]|nr:winged helix-turn-helix domain-containing protein [Myxococcaceae bacterium]
MAAYLQQRTQVHLSPAWVGELLICHGFVWRRTQRTTRHLPDPEEKRARCSTPSSPQKGRLLAGRGLRAVVRGR